MRSEPDRLCSALPDCGRPVRGPQLDVCEGHYTQRRRGKAFKPLRPQFVGATCEIVGCERPREGRYCPMHRCRIQRHGDPDVYIHQRDRDLPRGEAHPHWTPIPSYSAIHQRLKNRRGPATRYACKCGQPARQWAYTGPRSPGERLPHEACLDLYVPMCVACHKSMDMARIAAVERDAP
jgi:hypothetical protein